MSNNYRNLVYAMTGQPVFPQYYDYHQTPTPRERTVREDLEEVVRQLEEKERQQAAANSVIDGTKCAANSYAHGYTYGASGELAGAAGAIGNMVANVQNGQNPMDDLVEAYASVRNNFRDYRKECENNYPVTTTAAEIAGIMSNPINVIRTNPLAPRSVHLANEVKNAGFSGVAYGFNTGEGDSLNHLRNMGRYGAVGALTPWLRRWLFSRYIPSFKGGELGAFRRNVFDNLSSTGINKSIDKIQD